MKNVLMERIENLVKLGEVLRTDEDLNNIIYKTAAINPWFTVDFTRMAITAITDKMLNREALEKWLSAYQIDDSQEKEDVKVGIIMAGNLPLVGFHDFLCAYTAGYGAKVKLSGKDEILFPYIFELLSHIDPDLKAHSAIIERLEGFNAVIATGSNNSHRYFEYYFRQYPKILRKNRNSIAVLTGSESDQELDALADDIFLYFGFGCRNVSKIYIPEDYDVRLLFPHFKKYKWMHENTKYMNNYDYNRTLLLMNRSEHLSDNIVMLQESEQISSPVAVVYYEKYKSLDELAPKLSGSLEHIQCIVANDGTGSKLGVKDHVPFGCSQYPGLSDYADGIDTMQFLLSLKG